MMKLFGTLTSPYTRKVRVALIEKRMECEFVIEAPDTPGSHVKTFNPLGKIPVLVLDDETAIYDSRVIVEHLDNASPGHRLIPDDNRPRTQVRRWEALADGCTDAAVAVLMELRRESAHQDESLLRRQHEKINSALQTMADDLGNKPWCTGDFFNLADIATGCCLGFLALRLPATDWRNDYPQLARLADKLALRPSFRDTNAQPQ